MTGFAIDLRRDRILIASDTLGYSLARPPKPLGFVPKIIPFPHLRAALFGRGSLAILATAGAQLMVKLGLYDFDSAVDILPDVLREATRHYALEMDVADPDALMLFEALWAGWSEKDGRMHITAFRNFEGDYAPVSEDADGLSSLPTLPGDYVPRGAGALPVDKQLVAVMQSLRRYFADHPEVVPAIIGGEISITEITKHGVATRMVHRFADFETTRIAAAAVAARYARGDEAFDIEAAVCRADDAIEAEDPAVVVRLSRAERRRSEKQQRRAAR